MFLKIVQRVFCTEPAPHRRANLPLACTSCTLCCADLDSDTLSQASQSQSRGSQGEPSTCSKAGSLGLPGGLSGAVSMGGGSSHQMFGKPPMHPNHHRGGRGKRIPVVEPPVIRNPYITPGNDESHVFHPSNSARPEPLPPKQNRLV